MSWPRIQRKTQGKGGALAAKAAGNARQRRCRTTPSSQPPTTSESECAPRYTLGKGGGRVSKLAQERRGEARRGEESRGDERREADLLMRPSRGFLNNKRLALSLGERASRKRWRRPSTRRLQARRRPVCARRRPRLRVSEWGPATQKVLHGRVHGGATAWPPRGAPIGPTTRAEGGGREGVAAAVASFGGEIKGGFV